MVRHTDSDEQEKITILDSLMEHVVYHDPDMKILWANRAACESVLMKRADLLGRYCYEVFMGRDKPCTPCHAMEVFNTGKIKQHEGPNPIDG
jgi:hypothetical protein